MGSCRNAQGLVAASLYETLSETDQIALNTHLAGCPRCAKEMETMKALVGEIPLRTESFAGDLLPALREALREEAVATRHSRWTMGSFALSCVVFGLISLYLFSAGSDAQPPVDERSPISLALEEAGLLSQSGQEMEARQVLENALAYHGDGPTAGVLYLEMASLEYNAFHRYEEAYSIYSMVRDEYSDVWAQCHGLLKDRFDLLTEARDSGYEALYAIDAARSQGEEGIPKLETIMARNPGRSIANEALQTMITVIEDDGVSGLETLRTRFTNPVAVAQLDVRLGERYWQEENNPERGKELLEAVVQGPHEVPAQMAAAVLDRLQLGID